MSDLQDTTTTEETGGLNRRQALGWASAVAAGAVGASVLTAPAAATSSSCSGLPPPTAIAPMAMPSTSIGRPPPMTE